MLSVAGDDGSDDDKDFALSRLLEVVGGCAKALAELRPHAETEIRWHASSSSSQGGFWLPARVLEGLALLRCDFIGTVYLGEDPQGSDA